MGFTCPVLMGPIWDPLPFAPGSPSGDSHGDYVGSLVGAMWETYGVRNSSYECHGNHMGPLWSLHGKYVGIAWVKAVSILRNQLTRQAA